MRRLRSRRERDQMTNAATAEKLKNPERNAWVKA
jgi:hypothetical protein